LRSLLSVSKHLNTGSQQFGIRAPTGPDISKQQPLTFLQQHRK
jgi:hypothetical protein